jgi:2-furoate---CoA ligase
MDIGRMLTWTADRYPDEIEGALARCPAVSAVVVVGLPDDRWGQAVTAFVVPAQDFYPERALSQLSHYARDGSGLASVKRPKRYIAVADVARTHPDGIPGPQNCVPAPAGAPQTR